MKNQPSQKKARRVLVLMTLLFLIPVVLAWLFFTHKTWLPKHTTNHGQLIAQPLTLRQLSLDPTETQHKWVLLFMQTGLCESPCQKKLSNMRQIQRALGKDMNRLTRVMLTAQEDGAADQWQSWLNHSETLHWQVSQDTLANVLGQTGSWYVIDPLGYFVLSYAADADPDGILDDLKYLMSVSTIG